jgi:hypothetical protein
MYVEYIALETTDEFVCLGQVRAIGKNAIVVMNQNSDIALWQKYEALDLVDDLEKGELKGKLKDIAATLDEESNPVIMLAKYKK